MTLFCRVLNASLDGMFIRTLRPTPPAAPLRLSFVDPGEGERVVARAEVVWRCGSTGPGEPGMGVHIVRFDQGAEAYERFVQRQLTAGSSPGLVLGLGADDNGLDEP